MTSEAMDPALARPRRGLGRQCGPRRPGSPGDQPGRPGGDPVPGGGADPAPRLPDRGHGRPAQGSVPGHGAGPPVRPRGATRCSGRASCPSGCRCWARRPRRSAPAGRCAPQDMAFPSYREHGVAWCRGVDPTELLGIFRGTDQTGWNPKEKRFHAYTIVIGNQVLNATGYAMGQKFDGVIGRSSDGPGSTDEATIVLLRGRRHLAGRRARGHGLRRRVRRAGRLLLPEQPVGDLRAGRAADPGAAVPPRPVATASRGSGWTATTCWPVWPSPGGRWTSVAPATVRC